MPALHHIVPRFYLARWADERGLIEIIDLEKRQASLEQPATFYRLRDFNTVLDADGNPDDWIEHALLGRLDGHAADAMNSLVHTDRVGSHIRKIRGNDWRHNHLMSRKRSVRFSMFIAAQAVRSPAFRQAVTNSTGRVMQRSVRDHYAAQIPTAATDEEREHFEYMSKLRLVVAEFDQNTLPRLSAELVYRLSEVLYYEYLWALRRFERPLVMLGDDPLVIHNLADPLRGGSFGQVATAGDEPFSLWDKPEAVIERGIEAISGHDALMLPIDPWHLLTLTKVDHLLLPGRYDDNDSLAVAYNLLLMRASRRWLCRLPGHDHAGQPTS
jgi:hypothetical protein